MNHNNNRYSFAPAWCDFDGEVGRICTSPMISARAISTGTARQVSREVAESGVENIGPGMSAAWFDYDGDGRPDLYVSNMWTGPGSACPRCRRSRRAVTVERRLRTATPKGNSLYRNRARRPVRGNQRSAEQCRDGPLGVVRGRP